MSDAPKLCAYGCGKEFTSVSRGKATAKGHAKCYRAKLHAEAMAGARLTELIEPAGGFAQSEVPRRIEHPKGWEPHVEESGNTATAISQPMETANPDEDMLIRGWNLDPKQWRIVGPVNCRRWETAAVIGDGEERRIETKWLYYYKANLQRIDPVRERDLAALIDEIRTHVFIPGERPVGDDALIVCLADSQMGKSDGDGVKGTVGRLLAAIDNVETRTAELRAIGRRLETLYFFGMGDLIENCDGHYPQQSFRVDLDLREQVNVMRRLILKAIERWSPLFSRVVVGAVGGNHGENRKDGKSFTTFADNHDVAIFDQVADVLSMNEATYGHVSFAIPKDDLSLTFDVYGKRTGISHGHAAGKGNAAFPAKKQIDWWMKQAHGQQPIGDADMLITAHYHHLLVTESGSKTHFQCPSLEGGSDWWTNVSGQKSRPGVLTFRAGANVSLAGWSDLYVA